VTRTALSLESEQRTNWFSCPLGLCLVSLAVRRQMESRGSAACCPRSVVLVSAYPVCLELVACACSFCCLLICVRLSVLMLLVGLCSSHVFLRGFCVVCTPAWSPHVRRARSIR
jgi:hypothetical protein